MRKSSLVIALTAAALTVSLWALFNRPDPEPPWPDHIQGFSFSPFHAGEDAIAHRFPSEGEIDADLQLLASKGGAVRTYTVEGTLGEVPRLAKPYHLSVMLGGWVDADET